MSSSRAKGLNKLYSVASCWIIIVMPFHFVAPPIDVLQFPPIRQRWTYHKYTQLSPSEIFRYCCTNLTVCPDMIIINKQKKKAFVLVLEPRSFIPRPVALPTLWSSLVNIHTARFNTETTFCPHVVFMFSVGFLQRTGTTSQTGFTDWSF